LKREARGSVVHELVHVVQNYGRARRTNPNATRTPGWLQEGIPDYIRWFLYEPGTKGAEITDRNLARAKYDASYRVTGNFLNWVTQKHDKEIVRKLNTALREGQYSEQMWKDWTGKTVQELGEEWKKGHEARLGAATKPASGSIRTNVAATANSFPNYRRPVMTWVPSYAVAQSKARLQESFDGAGMKDALTHLGLQFWVPAKEGGIARAGRTNDTSDAAIAGLRDWGHTNGVRVLLCVYDHVKSWDWTLARAGFARNPDRFTEALLTEVDRLQLDGVDVDLEGNGSFEADKDAFIAFIRRLSEKLHARSRHLTVDTFSHKWNAPNQTWWKELLPHVDGLTTMGYEELGLKAPEWRGYAFQKAAAGELAAKLMIGLPSGRKAWRGNTVMEHLQWLKDDGGVGMSFWDAQVNSDAWRKPDVWKTLGEIRGRP
jgi:hypothetical protein